MGRAGCSAQSRPAESIRWSSGRSAGLAARYEPSSWPRYLCRREGQSRCRYVGVHGDFLPIDTTFYVVPRDGNRELPFLFFALTAQDLPSVSADSAVPGLNRNLAYMNRQLVPDKRVVDEFNDYAVATFSRRHRLEEECRALAAQRDVLLPKLVSGEVGVRNLLEHPHKE